MGKTIIIISLILVGLFSAAVARIINVPADFATIQAGIDASQNGDTVLVGPGTYAEYLLVEDKNILLCNTGLPESTIVSGYITFRGASIDTSCVLQGFTLIRSSGITHDLLVIVDASPKIQGNIILGGGWVSYILVILTNSEAVIRSNIIRDHFSNYIGHGIQSDSGFPTIDRNIIINNVGISGFSPYVWGVIMDAGILKYNVVAYNGASGAEGAAGGGVCVRGGPYEVVNNTIMGNWAYGYMSQAYGGGLLFRVPSDGYRRVIRNNIIAKNRYKYGAYGIIDDPTWTGWDYNLVYNNDSSDYVGFQPGLHDIQADPMFVDADSGDFHLLPDSPCIDAGDPSFPLDPDSTRADIGAYFFDQAVDIDDPGPNEPYQFALSQNYPNPFNARTVISYCLDEDAVVSMRIHSITGKLIKIIVDKEAQEAGEHRFIWDGTDRMDKPVSTGIYFYELHVDDYKESKAMILIK